MSGVFVTGTDTNAGKTIACAVLVRKFGAHYWKPAQTGVPEDAADTDTVARLAELPPARIHPPRHVFRAPLSVLAAATREGARVSLADFTLPATGGAPLVVEGAGGCLVPLSEDALMVDLIARLGLPALIVARTALGTINHSLLTVEALRGRNIPVAGILFSGEDNPETIALIARFGQVRVLGCIPPLARLDAAAIAMAGHYVSGDVMQG